MKNKKEKQRETHTIPYRQHIISLICVAIITFGATYFVLDEKYYQKSVSSQDLSANLGKIQSLYDNIHANYVGKVDDEKLIDGALKGMTDALDDPYSTYLDKTETQSFNEQIDGSIQGIGATITMKNGELTFAEDPKEGTPSAKAKLQKGDVITKVDGKSVKGQTLEEAVSKVRGKKGTEVTLEIKRDNKTFDVTLKRDTIQLDTVTGKITAENKSIGYIAITSFSKNTASEFKNTVKKLRNEGATAFIFDVRGNLGGLASAVEQMASMCLANGDIIVQFEDKDGNNTKVKAGRAYDGGFKIKEPSVVLMNGTSASASEIFAAALNESAGVPLIGTKTYGKGTAQEPNQFNDNSEVKITTSKWLTPKGNWIHEKGIKPTIEADFPKFGYATTIDTSKTYQKGDSGEAITNIQLILQGAGYEKQKLTGTFDEDTENHVKDYQKKNKLTVNGKVDKETAQALEKKIATILMDGDGAYKKAIETLAKEQ